MATDLEVRQMVQRHGCPLALYHDQHGIFTQTGAATERDSLPEQLAGKQEPTQFGRLLQELEITSLAERSPQAKGWVERLFGTRARSTGCGIAFGRRQHTGAGQCGRTGISAALQCPVCRRSR